MKKRIGILFVYVLIFCCYAKSEHRISLGFGVMSHSYLHEYSWEHSDIDCYFPGPYDDGTYKYPQRELKSIPINLNFHYECTLGKHFGVGLCLGYDYIRMDQKTEVINSTGYIVEPNGEIVTNWEHYYEVGELRRHILLIMPEGIGYYFKKEKVSLYGKIAAGIRFTIEKEEVDMPEYVTSESLDHHFSFQFSPICVEFGRQYWRGFVELGYGTQGVGQIGVKHTFHQ